jgi:hypothetical protein
MCRCIRPYFTPVADHPGMGCSRTGIIKDQKLPSSGQSKPSSLLSRSIASSCVSGIHHERLLCGSAHKQANKAIQLANRTLIKVRGSSPNWFQLLTVISKMQAVLEFNDVRSVIVIRFDRRHDTQTSCMRGPPSPSYANSVSSSYGDRSTALIEHVHSIAFHLIVLIVVLMKRSQRMREHETSNLIALSDAVFNGRTEVNPCIDA